MTGLSPEQQAIVALPLKPIAVTACAGSGKTRTAVRRLAAMRALHQDERSLVALLSFSNAAVEAFRREYATALETYPSTRRLRAVEIDTVDGFITTNVLRPHGHRTMRSQRTPFLVEGREPFLKSFTVFDGGRSLPTTELNIALDGGKFAYTVGRGAQSIDQARAEGAIAKLAEVGAYTHASGRYWVLRVLREQPSILAALARRYPHILVDEAQDIGPEHQAIFELLIKRGTQLSLVGDPHQAIYEFARADGSFLSEYGGRPEVDKQRLSVNYRSVPSILEVANKLTERDDRADRTAQEGRHGAFFMAYDSKDRGAALGSFQSILGAAGIESGSGVVLCRSSDLAKEWSGELDAQGVGVVRCFANAAISRDHHGKLAQAFSETCMGVVGLLGPDNRELASTLLRGGTQDISQVRRAIWNFARDPENGLPSATLLADTEWHPRLSQRVRGLLGELEERFGLLPGDNLGNKLAKRELANRPLMEVRNLAEGELTKFRVSTVHKVKGASLEAVLYVAKKGHVEAFLGGTRTEEGRIGYVALTRARDLFVLAVPKKCIADFESPLRELGFQYCG